MHDIKEIHKWNLPIFLCFTCKFIPFHSAKYCSKLVVFFLNEYSEKKIYTDTNAMKVTSHNVFYWNAKSMILW